MIRYRNIRNRQAIHWATDFIARDSWCGRRRVGAEHKRGALWSLLCAPLFRGRPARATVCRVIFL